MAADQDHLARGREGTRFPRSHLFPLQADSALLTVPPLPRLQGALNPDRPDRHFQSQPRTTGQFAATSMSWREGDLLIMEGVTSPWPARLDLKRVARPWSWSTFWSNNFWATMTCFHRFFGFQRSWWRSPAGALHSPIFQAELPEVFSSSSRRYRRWPWSYLRITKFKYTKFPWDQISTGDHMQIFTGCFFSTGILLEKVSSWWLLGCCGTEVIGSMGIGSMGKL